MLTGTFIFFFFSNMMIVTNKRDYKFNEVKDALNRGADVNKTDDDGNTPLHIATMSDSYKTVQLLIDRGAKRKYNSLSLSLFYYDYYDYVYHNNCLIYHSRYSECS